MFSSQNVFQAKNVIAYNYDSNYYNLMFYDCINVIFIASSTE